MRRLWMLVPVAMILVLGCAGGKTDTADTGEETPDMAAADDAAAAAGSGGEVAASPGMLEAPAGASMASVSMEGTLGCGHCNFHVTGGCALAFRSGDGDIYMVDAGDRQEELMDHRLDEPAAMIAGRVSEVEGQKVIYTESVELR